VEKKFRIKEPPVPVISKPSKDAWFFHWFSDFFENFQNDRSMPRPLM
jgi:hypothetical protein